MYTQIVLTLNKDKIYFRVFRSWILGSIEARALRSFAPSLKIHCLYIYFFDRVTDSVRICLPVFIILTKTFLRVELKYPSEQRYFLSSTFLFIYSFFFGCWVLLGSFASWASFMAAENFWIWVFSIIAF